MLVLTPCRFTTSCSSETSVSACVTTRCQLYWDYEASCHHFFFATVLATFRQVVPVGACIVIFVRKMLFFLGYFTLVKFMVGVASLYGLDGPGIES
jgi:hypothetical protein